MTHFWPGENSCGFDWLTQLGFSAARHSAGLSAGAPNKSGEHIGDYIQGIRAFRSIEIIPCGPNFLVFVTLKQTSWLALLHSAPRVWTAASPPGVFLPAFHPALEPQALLWPLHHCLALRPGLHLNQLTGRENLGVLDTEWGEENAVCLHRVWLWTQSFEKNYLGLLYHSLTLEMWCPSHVFTAFFPDSTKGLCMLSWAWARQTHLFPASWPHIY